MTKDMIKNLAVAGGLIAVALASAVARPPALLR